MGTVGQFQWGMMGLFVQLVSLMFAGAFFDYVLKLKQQQEEYAKVIAGTSMALGLGAASYVALILGVFDQWETLLHTR
jgi:hypothetical protein